MRPSLSCERWDGGGQRLVPCWLGPTQSEILAGIARYNAGEAEAGGYGSVRAAYHRALYLEDRVKLTQWWADYLDGRKTGNVVKMPKRKA